MAKYVRTVNERVNKASSKLSSRPVADLAAIKTAIKPTQSIDCISSTPNLARSLGILQLQRTLGNRAVGTLLGRSVPRGPVIQAKLIVNAPGDKYEQEADRVAEQVMRMPTVQPGEIEEINKHAD